MNHKRINARIQKWRTMIKQGLHKDEELLKSRIRKGIPQAIRALAWPEIVSLRQFCKEKEKKSYTYEKLINTPSKSTYDITLDIPRTFPQEQDSKILRKSLNNVLKAISIVYVKMGYCQGMNFLALRLLQVIDDQETFWLLHYLLEIDPSLMKNFIEPKKIQEETLIFTELMKIYIPKIHNRLLEFKLIPEIYTVKWFMTIFSSSLKQQAFYRIFQIYLNEGWSVLYKVGITLLKNHEQEILSQSFDNVVLVINNQMNIIGDVDQFVVKVCSIEMEDQLLGKIRNKALGQKEIDKNGFEHKNEIRESRVGFQFPIPQEEHRQEINFQRKAEEVTFEVFNYIKASKK